ncbi:FtsW/RodA/SpoVE family cell cycle protein [Roseofilum capinflatum]|uniref:Probable peptidoglycan glycosyltransferase FtsW n=1 Tax=Roseofilum capinflatum BLCC-M114 TaxID=3022440 RepID=A0ABT7BAT6_9CYAN|nr:FtsW/RodA/SpoVE family cell cycle protein [Roseofilum capinflatum]MDJ1176294.1 FtsW/RodA/SpoVE family cell cycle protein [Roseofilum capinflatum BLCC-M114]
MKLQQLIPLIDPSVKEWAMEARLLRWLTFLWLSVGLVILFSASYPLANSHGDGFYYVKRQMAWALLGCVGFNVMVYTPLKSLMRVSQWVLLLLLGLIGVTVIPGLGTTINGATRWLSLGGLPLQPSELIKPFLVLQGAQVFGWWPSLRPIIRWRWLAIFGAVLVGILLQPNLSTATFCGMTLFAIAVASGLPYRLLLTTGGVGLGLGLLSLSINEYQRRRIMTFLDPWADPVNDGYQLIQSLLAIGSGGFWGTGLGLSQQKWFYLPIHYTDFIFAVYAEEFGFVGSLLLLLMLGVYATLGLMVALKSTDKLHRLIAIGATFLLVGQSLINIGVATGALPTTGLPFPMFSYGGNSMIASLLSAGLLVRVARESRQAAVVSLEERRSRASNSR